MSTGAGMRSLALCFPRAVRTNAYWRTRYPEQVATAESRTLTKIWSPPEGAAPPADAFTLEMRPFLGDPFRGAVERRVLAPGETALSIELGAARQALEAARMAPDDVELLICSSFLPDAVGVGNGVFLAKELGLSAAAWNLETACAGSLVAFETACALVRARTYRTVLVVVSCTYSRTTDEADSLSWSVGDGAAAFVVGSVPGGEGMLGSKTVNTASTIGAMYYAQECGPAGTLVRMKSGPGAGAAIRDTALRVANECCRGAAQASGLALSDIGFFATTTPTAWYSSFLARELGFDPERTLSTHALYANTGPVLMPTNLFYAAKVGKIRPGTLVMLHAVGSVSSASAAVVRWGEVGLGTMPGPGVP